jgi:hypothetical protein
MDELRLNLLNAAVAAQLAGAPPDLSNELLICLGRIAEASQAGVMVPDAIGDRARRALAAWQAFKESCM